MELTMYQRFSNIVLEKGMEEAAKTALRLGFSSVEPLTLLGNNPLLPFASVADAREKRRILDDYRLPMVCYSVGVNLFQNPEGERQLMEQADRIGPSRKGRQHTAAPREQIFVDRNHVEMRFYLPGSV